MLIQLREFKIGFLDLCLIIFNDFGFFIYDNTNDLQATLYHISYLA